MIANEIIVALITGGVSLLGTIFSVSIIQSKTLYRIEQLEKKMDKHNSVVERVYKLEKDDEVHSEQIRVANHRIEDLEKAT